MLLKLKFFLFHLIYCVAEVSFIYNAHLTVIISHAAVCTMPVQSFCIITAYRTFDLSFRMTAHVFSFRR
jgi:hypothetical protein